MTEPEPHFLFLGVHSPVIERMWKEGLTTSVVSTTDGLGRHPSPGDHRWVFDLPDDPGRVVDMITAAQPAARFTAVVATDDPNMATAAAIRDRLGLGGGDDSRVVRQVHDKRAYRELLDAARLPVPRHREVRTAAEAVAFGDEVGWPIVVKPVSGSGSGGVTVDVHAERATGAFEWAAQTTPDSPTGRVLVEEQVVGDLLTVDTLSRRGRHHLLMIGFELVAQNRPIIMCTGMPAPLPKAAWDEVGRVVLTALDALGVSTGPVHTEVLMTASGPVLLESQLRLGGELPELTQGSVGIDTYQLWADVLLGRDPLERVDLTGHGPEDGTPTVVLYPAPHRYGRLVGVQGLDLARGSNDVTHVQLNNTVRMDTRPVSDNDDRVMAVFAQGTTARRAIRSGLRAIAQTRIRIAPDPVLPPGAARP